MVKEKEYLYEGEVFEMSGNSFTIKQLSKAFDVPARILRTRFRGRDVVTDQNLLPTKPMQDPRRVRFAGEEDYNGLEVGNTYTVSDFSRAAGINSNTMQNRLRGLTEADERHLGEARPKSNLYNSPFIHEADTARGHELNVMSRAALKKPLINQKVIASMGLNNERKWR